MFVRIFVSLVSFLLCFKANACEVRDSFGILQVDCALGSLSIAEKNNSRYYNVLLRGGLELELAKASFGLEDFSVVPGVRLVPSIDLQDRNFFAEVTEFLSLKDKEVLEVFFRGLPLSEDLSFLEKASLEPGQAGRSYRSICRYIGKRRTAYFTVQGKKRRKRLRVGRKSSGCYGRCGQQCSGLQRYTQECLNHDACAYDQGENLGECSQEFWNASDGFFGAPECKKSQ